MCWAAGLGQVEDAPSEIRGFLLGAASAAGAGLRTILVVASHVLAYFRNFSTSQLTTWIEVLRHAPPQF